jgi:signal transduction histidine kinase
MAARDQHSTDVEAECGRLTEALKLAERDLQLLGFEIHDGVLQDLTAAAMLLDGAARDASFASAEGKQSFDGGVRLLQEGIAAARRLVQGSITFQHQHRGLVLELDHLVARFRQEYGLPVTFVRAVKSDPRLLPSEEHLLLRIAQESLHNVRKHAGASEVEVRLGVNDGRLELVIADNGGGFDPALVSAGHYGLESIRARARVLNADLLIDTAPQHGTRIVVRLHRSAIV